MTAPPGRLVPDNWNEMKYLKRISITAWLGCSFLLAQAQGIYGSETQGNQTFDAKPMPSLIFNNTVPKYEVRAVWLTTIGGIDWPHSYSQSPHSAEKQQAELVRILDKLQQAHINTVLIQTRIRGTVIYPSRLEPWDGCLSGFPGRTPGYDALKFAIDECHKRGMEVHAWVVTLPVGKWEALGCKQLRKRFPGLIRKIGADGYMNPEDSRTGDYLAKICGEIAHSYDVDGIHLDYIRYPETWNIKVGRQQARGYITRIVEKIHAAVKGEKPWIKMSCSPVGKFDDLSRYWSHGWNAYTKVCQDAQGWLKAGLMDELFPMMYFRNEQFYPFAIDWKEQSDGKIVVPGLGVYFLDPKEGKWKIGDITQEMYHLRNLGVGYAFFRNKFFLDNQQGIYDFTKSFNAYPALVPPMTWESDKRPQRPGDIRVRQVGDKLSLSWDVPSQYEDGSRISTPYIYNNVYASRNYPVDVNDARNLISARNPNRSLTLNVQNDENPLYFAVTTMDGYGNESQGRQLLEQYVTKKRDLVGKARMLRCDATWLELPSETKNIEISCFVVESLDERALMRVRVKGNYLNVSRLASGVYVLKCMNSRGVFHTLGTFIYKKNEKS